MQIDRPFSFDCRGGFSFFLPPGMASWHSRQNFQAAKALFKKDLGFFFRTSTGWVLLALGTALSAALLFLTGEFFAIGEADLSPLWRQLPWVLVLFAAAATMRLWPEEREAGTSELVGTWPVAPPWPHLAKFAAAWALLGLQLLCLLPMVGVVAFLGDVDGTVVFSALLGAFLVGGVFVALSLGLAWFCQSGLVAFLVSALAGLALSFWGTGLFDQSLRAAGMAPTTIELWGDLGPTPWFESFAMGLIDLGGVIYLLALIVLLALLPFLFRLSRLFYVGWLVALLAVVFAAGPTRWTWDATDEGRFSVPEGMLALLEKENDPIALTLYFSKHTPGVANETRQFARQIERQLKALARKSGGKVTFSVEHPAAESQEAKKARKLGLTEAIWEGEAIFFGLHAAQGANDRVISLLTEDRQAFFAQDLARLILRVRQPQKPVLGLMTSLEVADPAAVADGRQQPGQLPAFMQELHQEFRVTPVQGRPDEQPLDVLLVLHPLAVTETAEETIAAHLLGGTPTVLVIDPLTHLEVASPNPESDRGAITWASDLPVLRSFLGLEFTANEIVVDPSLASEVDVPESPVNLLYPGQLTLEKPSAPLDAAFVKSRIRFADAGALSKKADSPLEFLPLVQTSPEGGLVSINAFESGGSTAVTKEKATGKGVQTLAAILRGQLPPPPPEKSDTAGPEIRLLALADLDFLNQGSTSTEQDAPDNYPLFFGMLDLLRNRPELTALRAPKVWPRPLKVLADERRAALEASRPALDRLDKKALETRRQLTDLQEQQHRDGVAGLDPATRTKARDLAATMADITGQRLQIRRTIDKPARTLAQNLTWLSILGLPVLFLLTYLLKRWLSRSFC